MQRIIAFGHQTFSSLKVRNYRLYFIGQAVSLCGTWMQTIGQAWLVLKITGSGTALGVITALQFLPILIFGPFGGVIADRFPKRKILYFTQSLSGILALILGILVMTDTVQLWMVGVLALCLGMVNAIDNPTRQTFVLEMVDTEQLGNAVSLNSMEINLTRVIGPTIAGILIAGVGLAWCFMINAFSYVGVLGALILMHERELSPPPRVTRIRGQLMEGFRYIAATPLLRNTLLMMAVIGTLAYEFIVSLPLLAEFTFHAGPHGYAALTGAMGLGSVLGGLFFTARRHTASPRLLIRAAMLLGGAMLLAAIAPNYTLAIIALVLIGIFSINFTSLGNVLLQVESAPEMRGRVMALWTVAFLGSTPIGGPIIGWIGEHQGPRWGIALGGLAAMAAAGLGAMTIGKASAFEILENIETSQETAAELGKRV
ncbi:MAG: MFS transporter [bacterium]|nr:MFS transporter [bacterium]MDZ4299666.1 MFS transporter [Candidatus Sungbacteria bacterium]